MTDYTLQERKASKKVLLADDDAEHTMLFNEAFLHVAPRTVLTAVENGDQVLEFLNQADSLPDMIVMDIHMPRKCGIETLKVLKATERLRYIPVIIFSASKQPEEVYECYRQNASCVLQKPNDYTGLVEIAQTLDLLMKSFY